MNAENFVGLLQEKCIKSRLAPAKYIEHGNNDGNMFTCLCLFDKWTIEGTGSNKKSAKQNAAKLMLAKLENEKVFESITNSPQTSCNKNAVSMLYEYSKKENQSDPLFSDKPEENDLYVVECSFNGFSGIGKDYNRKKAKEMSADIVLKHFNIHEYFLNLEKGNQRLKTLKNSVSKLHELCQTKKLNITFNEEITMSASQTLYEVTCIVGEFKTRSSKSISKKDAKIEASTLMLINLLGATTVAASPPENPQSTSTEDSEDSDASPIKRKKID